MPLSQEVAWSTGELVHWWTMKAPTEDLTWRFEIYLLDPDRWVPVTADLVGGDHDAILAPCVGTHEVTEIYQDAKAVAPDELAEALVDLVHVGDPLGMARARIVVWDGIGTEGTPSTVLEASKDQLAVARLELATWEVQDALRNVERARATVRSRIIRAATEDRLGRNQIARAVSGALSRRLVLQLLTGYDAVEAIRDALQSAHWARSKDWRWYGDPGYVEWLDQVESGHFSAGPACLDLQPNGQVYVRLVRSRSLWEHHDIDPGDTEAWDAAESAYAEALTAEGDKYAPKVLSAIAGAGFRVVDDKGADATVDALARTISATAGLLVREDS